MPGETELHKTLKREACRWLFRTGYRCVAAEVTLRPVGIVDAVGTGTFGTWRNHLNLPRTISQVCIVECKASRSDFLRDVSNNGQLEFSIMEWQSRLRTRKARGLPRRRRTPGLGKFDNCLLFPLANLHYILAPAGMLTKKDLPARWGLLSLGPGGVSVVQKAAWQETSAAGFVESQIARTLTCDIHNADTRAMNSANREMLAQQQRLAERIRAVTAISAAG